MIFNIYRADPVYFYELPSSIASSPHPCHWASMVSLYGERFGECPQGVVCVLQVWEAWWLKYHSDNVLYTLYPAHQVTGRVHLIDLGIIPVQTSTEILFRVLFTWSSPDFCRR